MDRLVGRRRHGSTCLGAGPDGSVPHRRPSVHLVCEPPSQSLPRFAAGVRDHPDDTHELTRAAGLCETALVRARASSSRPGHILVREADFGQLTGRLENAQEAQVPPCSSWPYDRRRPRSHPCRGMDQRVSGAPTVSIVVIFFNDGTFLEEAITSAHRQTFGDWELILADDGSTDESTAIARRHAEARPDRVRYVEHEGHMNRGISATRNLGTAHAAGRYIAFLDSDDVWRPNKLTEQLALLEAHPEVGLVFGASTYWWSWSEGGRTDRDMPIGAAQDVVHQPPSLVTVLYPLGAGTSPCPSSCMVRRSEYERIGGFEEHMPGLYDDQGFLAKAYLETPVYVSSRCWDLYRRHPGAVTLSTSRAQYDEVRRYFLAWYEAQLRERGIQDRAIWAALRRAGLPYRHPWLAATHRGLASLLTRARRSADPR